MGETLTVTASYFDGHSAPDADATDKTAVEMSVVVERDTRNKAPVFGDEDPDTSGVQNSAATRKVEEKTTGSVGAPVAASDSKADGSDESLQYRLSGTDMSSFKVDNDGQIAVGSGTKLDYEGKRTYMVTVTATDPLGASSSIPVTIEVTNVDEAPEIMLGGLAISGDRTVEVEEGSTAVATYSATGPESANASWTLGGDDAGDFRISNSGELTFVRAPDYENPADANMDNTYMVTVEGRRRHLHGIRRDVTVRVRDVDEVDRQWHPARAGMTWTTTA